MELNITELDGLNTMNPYEMPNYDNYKQDEANYWDNNKTNKIKKKKVTFTDILSNMNIVVNKQGVLQYMGMNEEINQEQPQQQYKQQQQYQQQYQQSYNYNPNDFTRQVQYNPNQQTSESIDPSVKHSYIYNKYFKDYVEPNVEKPGPRVPKTIEEYYQMLLDDKIKAIEHKKRIEQIKSKKLLFTSVPGVQTNPRNIQPTRNNLRMMNFR
jgi:hypothetical protein